MTALALFGDAKDCGEDVAFCVWQYYTITCGQDYMDRYGHELILDCARL